MPITAVAAATASLKDSALVSERRRINSPVRQQTFEWLDRNHYSYIPPNPTVLCSTPNVQPNQSATLWRTKK